MGQAQNAYAPLGGRVLPALVARSRSSSTKLPMGRVCVLVAVLLVLLVGPAPQTAAQVVRVAAKRPTVDERMAAIPAPWD